MSRISHLPVATLLEVVLNKISTSSSVSLGLWPRYANGSGLTAECLRHLTNEEWLITNH
ncbi:MAG: hypothetical protein F6J94_12930 [Moorea sp. SIO1F2]|uniref:hypothetical protein n=1 Tax=unclassified Moorena TaxID=2683338 RepID=UPI0013BCE1A3|nr:MULTISPECIES: hypothetical protein [unclassified Moorena]NEN99181.1 hypothetical protein [Moorena sp. SIO3I7]NEO19039.1 hypothetical protein [Moorena sp. SIO4A5]NEP26575.1 hypothetical protein [Moorena sp. SIO3I6]NEQ56381.1 hypothetical protein [Moorena sp. SIO4A1]NET82792.1 hypothetical protein [Moorena sp. SIO1F2]